MENETPENDDSLNIDVKVTNDPPQVPAPPKPQPKCCGNCDAFLPRTPQVGLCRALPPSPILLGMTQSGIDLGGMRAPQQPMVDGFYPPVAINNWCRFWQPNLGNGGNG